MYYLCSNTQCNTTGLKNQGALSPFRGTMCLCCFPHSPSQTQPSSISCFSAISLVHTLRWQVLLYSAHLSLGEKVWFCHVQLVFLRSTFPFHLWHMTEY